MLSSSRQVTLDVVQTSIKESLASVMRYLSKSVEDGRRKDVDECVHRLRVSTRRLTAALQLFDDFVPGKATRRLIRKLTTLRQVAGAARDCDVFVRHFDQSLEGEAGESLAKELVQWRGEAQKSLAELYRKWDRGERLERRATDVLCDIRPRGSKSDDDQESFKKLARRRLRRTVRRFFAGERADPTNLKRLHAFRIRVKRLRYCLELLRPGLDDKAVRVALKQLRKLSLRLGEINDHATAVELLTQWRNDKSGHDNGETSVASLLNSLRKREQKALRDSVDVFREWWTGKRQRRLHQRLKEAYHRRKTADAASGQVRAGK